MANRSTILKSMIEFFREKGRVLSELEYKEEQDTPFSSFYVKRYLGTWNNVIRKVTPFLENLDEKLDEIKDDTTVVTDAVVETVADIVDAVTGTDHAVKDTNDSAIKK